jgi:A/G-specific adenine glycosylase
MNNQLLQDQKKLLTWFEVYGREHLPWRDPKDVYHVYLSEVMLQQTQVSRVKEHYYPLFLEKYPTLQALAQTHIDELLASWSGLGYYSRARSLHKTSQICHKEGLPNTMKSLQKLPGIGRYTASAICSFGYDQCVSVVDTNIARVLKRYFGLLDVKEQVVWKYADKFLNQNQPKSHNLALMDLGSMICTAKKTSCDHCPLSDNCIGKDDPMMYTKTKKIAYEHLDLFLGINIKSGKIGMLQSKERLYNGLLIYPHVDPIDEKKLCQFKHSYTKYRIDVHLYESDYESDETVWVSLNDIENMPISSMVKKSLKFLSDSL